MKKIYILLFLALCSANYLAAQTCASPATLVTGTTQTGDTATAGDTFDDSCMGNYDGGDDYVFAYTAGPADDGQVLHLEMTPDDTYSGIAIATGTCGDAMTCVADEGNSTSDLRVVEATMTNGTTYYVVISTWEAPQDVGFSLASSVIPPPPPAPDCAAPTTLIPGTTQTGDTSEGGDTFDNSCMGSYDAGDDYVFAYTAGPADDGQVLHLEMTPDDTYSGIAIATGTCGDAMICVADEGNSTSDLRVVEAIMTNGTTYYVAISRLLSGSVGFSLASSVIDPPPPAGCLNPAVVTPICTDQPVTFSAGTNQTEADIANPSVGYGCLSNTPNPAWYYLEINANGTLSFDISNSNTVDVDWAAWGPFTDLADINTDCASGASPFDTPVDCDYSTDATGIIDLGTVTAGDVYAVLVTNYANTPTDVSMSTTVGSTATTDCSILPPDGYWINSTAPAAGSWGTCPYPVITDASGTMYDEFGPSSPTPNGPSQVVSVCPDGAATVDLTITYNLQDPLGLTNELVAIFDDKSRNDGLNELANLSGTGTESYTTTGPCFSILYQPRGGAGFQIDWSVNTAGAGTTFVQGDMCEDPFLLTDTNTPLAMSAVGATSGPVYNAGAIVSGTGCDPDLIGDGCTTTVENTIYAKFTSCAAGGSATLTLAPSTCNSSGQTPQMFLYTGTCGSHTFVDCVSSLAMGGSPTLTATLAAGTEYTVVIDGFRGIECDFTLDVSGCISTAAVTCADCLETACNTNPVQTDFGTSEANFGGDCWDTATGATGTLGPIVTADVAGTETVCTDFDASSFANFIGFDQCVSYINEDGTGGFQNTAFTLTTAIYQEVGGACVALVPTNTNTYGLPEFDNNVTAGTTPGDLGSFDPALPITLCYTYTSDGSGAAGDDDVQGNIPVGYGCTAVSTITAAAPSACNPADNTYTVDVTVTIPSLPASGGTTADREVDINGQTFTMTTTTETFTLTGLTADGAAVDVTAFMSVSTGCTTTSSALFTAPAACAIPSCADCLEAACNTNPVQTDFGTSEANFGGDCWAGSIGATGTLGPIVTADVAGTQTVCTDFDVSSFANFIGFDNCVSYIDDNASGTSELTPFTLTSSFYQEVGGACVALVPTNTNAYGQPEFDNNITAGTTPGDLGSFDPTLPITFCYTYTSDGSGAAGDDDVQGNIPVAYGCTAVSTITAGAPSACNPADDTYTVDVTVTIPTLPAAGGTTADREVDINGQTFVMTATTETFTLTGLTADGAAVDVTAFMSVSTGCTTTSSALFTAPVACSVSCTPNAGAISTP